MRLDEATLGALRDRGLKRDEAERLLRAHPCRAGEVLRCRLCDRGVTRVLVNGQSASVDTTCPNCNAKIHATVRRNTPCSGSMTVTTSILPDTAVLVFLCRRCETEEAYRLPSVLSGMAPGSPSTASSDSARSSTVTPASGKPST